MWEDQILLYLPKKDSFYNGGSKTLEQVTHRGGGCSIPRNRQGEVGPGSQKPDLVQDVPAHGRGLGLYGRQSQNILWFYHEKLAHFDFHCYQKGEYTVNI